MPLGISLQAPATEHLFDSFEFYFHLFIFVGSLGGSRKRRDLQCSSIREDRSGRDLDGPIHTRLLVFGFCIYFDFCTLLQCGYELRMMNLEHWVCRRMGSAFEMSLGLHAIDEDGVMQIIFDMEELSLSLDV